MKAVTQPIRKYYKYQYSQFTRPNLSGYGLLGGGSFTCADDGTHSPAYYPLYKAFNGEMTGTYNQWISATAIGNVTIYNPKPINVSQFTITNGSSGGNYAIGNIEFYVSNDNVNYTYVTTYTASIFTAEYTHNIPISVNGYYKYYKLRIQSNQGTSSYCYVREIQMTAIEQEVIEGTSSDYDYYKDVTECQHISQPVRKYYKYQTSSWTQPVLTWNGLVNGSDFAVYASYEGTPAYYAFDDNASNYWSGGSIVSGNTIDYFIFSQNKLNISNWNYKISSNTYNRPEEGSIYGSNDNENWTLITSYSIERVAGTTTFDISMNANYYNYYKWHITSSSNGIPISGGKWSNGFRCNITLTATQQTIVEGTSSDYDFYKDITNYKAIV